MTTRIISQTNEKLAALSVDSDQTVRFDFDPASSSFSREGDDLLVEFNDGGSVLIESFFNGDGLPDIELEDGSIIAGKDFFAGVSPDMDITTAAGATPALSGGSSGYADDAGTLVSGVDSLDALSKLAMEQGASAYGPVVSAGTVFPNATESVTGPFAPSPGPLDPPSPPEPDPSDSLASYSARAVLYRGDDAASSQVTAEYIDENGIPQSGTPSTSWLTGDGFADGVPLVTAAYVDGRIVFTLTDAGKAFFDNPDNAGKAFIEAIFQVTDPATGKSYNMQVIVPREPSFVSSDMEGVETEYSKATNESDLVHGEWHQGNKSLGSYDIVSSNLDDELIFAGSVTGSSIITGFDPDGEWGDDLIAIEGALQADASGNNTLLTGNGQDSVTIGLVQATGGGRNTIDTGLGYNDEVFLTGGEMSTRDGTFDAGMYASGRNSVNIVDTEGTFSTDVDGGANRGYGLYAHSRGVNDISAGSIDIVAESDTRAYGVYSWAGTNRFTLDDPSGTVYVRGGADTGNHAGYGTMVRENGTLEVNGNYSTTGQSGSNYAYGLVGGKGANNTITVEGTLTASAKSITGNAEGLLLNESGTLNIDADAVNLNATSDTALAYGIFADNSTLNMADIKLTIDVQAGTSARGIYSKSTKGGSTINAGEIDLSVNSTKGNAWALIANNADLTVNADVFIANITANVPDGAPVNTNGLYGMLVSGTNVTNQLNAGTVDLNVTGQGRVVGMESYANDAGASAGDTVINRIVGERVDIDVTTSGNSNAVGMYAYSNKALANNPHAVNIIEAAEDSAVIVTITAKSGGLNRAYAMYTDGDYTRNEINGGDKNDMVDLHGMVKGNNFINTGDGDDVIRLDGKVTGLDLQAGDGHDTLILQADDIASFNANYESWLGSMTLEELHAMGIESLVISTKNGSLDGTNGLDWLLDKINDYNAAYGPSGSVEQGEGIDLSHAAIGDMDDLLEVFNPQDGLTGPLGDVLVDADMSHAASPAPLNADVFTIADTGSWQSSTDENLLLMQHIMQTNN